MSGDGVVAHNRRTFISKNVDPTRTHTEERRKAASDLAKKNIENLRRNAKQSL